MGAELKCLWMLDGKSLGAGAITKSSAGWTVEKTIGAAPGTLASGTHEVRFLVEDGHNDFSGKDAAPSSKAPQAKWWWLRVHDALGKPVTLDADGAWN